MSVQHRHMQFGLARLGFLCHGERCQRRRSSVVEHTLGKGEVESSILSGGTIWLIFLCLVVFLPLEGWGDDILRSPGAEGIPILRDLREQQDSAAAPSAEEKACRVLLEKARLDPTYKPTEGVRAATLENAPPSLQTRHIPHGPVVRQQMPDGKTVYIPAQEALNQEQIAIDAPAPSLQDCLKKYSDSARS